VPAAVCRRIVIAQALYAFGALLCIINTHWSIAFIVAGPTLLRRCAALVAVIQTNAFSIQGIEISPAAAGVAGGV
jgi:hypothetical protein